jgi:[ribosomal protein S18]-alanine N-acetyltransferase
MTGWLDRLLGRTAVVSEASTRDAAAIANLHAAAFQRGWSEQEIERLLIERNVFTQRAMLGRKLVGFVMSRDAAGEAEILSIAVHASQRGRGIARQMLDLHLRRLAGLGVRTIFLEVDEDNAPARRLYSRSGFRQVGRREAYYGRGPNGKGGTALVLRRDLV